MAKIKLTTFANDLDRCTCSSSRRVTHPDSCPLAGRRRFIHLTDDPSAIEAEAIEVAKSNATTFGGLLTPAEENVELFPLPGESADPSIEKPDALVALKGRVLHIKFSSIQKFKDVVGSQPANQTATTALRASARNAKLPNSSIAQKRKRGNSVSAETPTGAKKRASTTAAPKKRGAKQTVLMHPYKASKNIVEFSAPITLHNPNLARGTRPKLDDAASTLIYTPMLTAEAQWLAMTQATQEKLTERVQRRLHTQEAVNDWFSAGDAWRARVLEYDSRNMYDRGGERRRRAKAEGPVTHVKGWGKRTWPDGSGAGVYVLPTRPRKRRRRV
jgi:hypothetical protein